MEIDEEIEEEAKHVNNTVKAILILDHTKKPFKQSDIMKYLSMKPSRKNWTSIFGNAIERLKDMGLILRETKNTHTKFYFLTSNLFPPNTLHQYAIKDEVADRTLLIIVLTFIFMREKSVSDVDILNHLQELRIYNPNNSVHSYFGDIRKRLFVDFVSQMYLEKIVDKEADKIEIKWGERANVEVTKRSILEFAIKIGYQNKIEPKNLVSHYMKVMEDEKEEQQKV